MAARAGDFTALAASAELSCCELDTSASVVHRWLRQHAPHDAVAVTAKGSSEPLSQWSSPMFELPAGIRWSSADSVRALAPGRPVVATSGVAASSGVTITVVLRPGQSPLAPGTERVLHALARVVAARAGRTPPATDTAPLSIAHAIAIERDRLTRELTDHFTQHLETILGLLRDDAASDHAERLHRAKAGASRALADLRERRTLWQQARRVDEAFALVESAIGPLARTAGVQLECTLAGPPQRVVADTVLEAASRITHAGLLNALEHAHATRVRVAWSVTGDELAVSVVDDGRGFDARRVGGGGLSALRRRAETLSGSLHVESVAEWGTHLQAHLRLHAGSVAGVDESASALVRTLGDREFEVLRLLAVGHRNREIASELTLSMHTVKFHVAKILEKLGVRTRAEAAAVAFAAGVHPRPQPAPVAADG
ncbi:LuxR C-terminal-related transcriptional regulator [Solirubrobacter ginsenosidimutans]|uniref:LuxR C-terminal-related transcriptional regulator n=1 Tax=Solirubrobacter ginsenosidimutans TaxID=490573 RepID=A0A9X3MTX7_9ACTN|nr:LuxR C-terminal-related transcriptional regulator [Solirubrobacter ginsenosidimutans]MDA0162619.1 LuxR C-terminal-related transcriptional regulator [Solirubrobacter ginsenosidimutans]